MAASKRRRGTAIVEIVHGGERGVLVMSDGGDWMLPGGGADRPHETRFEAAIRELYEETGLRASAAVTLFDHDTSNAHRVCFIQATGTPTIRDPREASALGFCRADLSVTPIEVLPGTTINGKLTQGTRAILERFAAYRAERPTFFTSLARYHEPEAAPDNQEMRGRGGERSGAHDGAPEPVGASLAFQQLDSLTINTAGGTRTIAIYQGDLTAIPPAEAVDVLVVSALPNSYRPSSKSLIGALNRRGVSVEALAADKAEDFRPTLACWLSKPIATAGPAVQFKRILCFEPKERGKPAEVIGDVFQCLTSMSSTTPIQSVAMPILAGRGQGATNLEIVIPLLEAAAEWLANGLPIKTIKIVASSALTAAELRGAFSVFKRQFKAPAAPIVPPVPTYKYDLFISYCWANKDDVDFLVDELKQQRPGIRIFLDRLELKPGAAWQHQIFQALDECAKIVTVYSPDYLQSKICLFEYNAALVRHRDANETVLMPIFLRTVALPTFMKLTQYLDCRESDQAKLRDAATKILAEVP